MLNSFNLVVTGRLHGPEPDARQGAEVMAFELAKRLRRKIHPGKRARITPAIRVLGTYELLELIMEYLDPRSLRQARRINHYWHSVICKSSTLEARAMQSHGVHELHIVLIGVLGIGINSLTDRFMTNGVDIGYDPTSGDELRKLFTVDDDRWLIEGVREYLDAPYGSSLLGHILRQSQGYMLLYSMNSRRSFDEVKAWLARMRSSTEPLSAFVAMSNAKQKHVSSGPQKCLPSALVSTNNDLGAEERQVSTAEGAALARELGCGFIETSARTGDGVEEAFVETCRIHKPVRMEQRRQEMKVALLKSPPRLLPGAIDRRERWWRWYRARQCRTRGGFVSRALGMSERPCNCGRP